MQVQVKPKKNKSVCVCKIIRSMHKLKISLNKIIKKYLLFLLINKKYLNNFF